MNVSNITPQLYKRMVNCEVLWENEWALKMTNKLNVSLTKIDDQQKYIYILFVLLFTLINSTLTVYFTLFLMLPLIFDFSY